MLPARSRINQVPMNQSSTDAIETWLRSTQFSDDRYFSPSGFEDSVQLYHTPLDLSFVQTVIDGTSRHAPFSNKNDGSRYQALVDAIRTVTEDEPAYWFYVTDPDNAVSLLSWIRVCNYEYAVEYHLSCFETSPAPEGGLAQLGLVGEDTRWMLLHQHNPCNDFRIEFHGSTALCSAVAELLLPE